MKNAKILLAVMLLALTATITSCMPDDDDKTYHLEGYFTITGSNPNYILYRDGGGIITPSVSSINTLTGGKGFANYKRAYMYLTYKEANYSTNEKNETIIDQAELQNGLYINTENIISKERADNEKITDKDSIYAIKTFENVWAYRGYVSTIISAFYDVKDKTGITPTIKMVYSPEDVKENAIKFHIYYNRHSVEGSSQYGPYSFMNSFPISEFDAIIPGTGDVEMTFEVDGAESKTIKVSREHFKQPNH